MTAPTHSRSRGARSPPRCTRESQHSRPGDSSKEPRKLARSVATSFRDLDWTRDAGKWQEGTVFATFDPLDSRPPPGDRTGFMTAAAHHTNGDATRAGKIPNVPSRPLRVCHVSLTLATGGMERLLADIARLHDPDVCRPEFLAIAEGGPFADQIRATGCVAETLDGDLPGRPDLRWRHLRRVDSMRRRFRERGYDV